MSGDAAFSYVYPFPVGTVRVPLTEDQAASMVLAGKDGEHDPRPFVNDDGLPVGRVGADGDTHALYLVTWELPEGARLGDGTDLSGRLLTTLECGPEPAMTLDPTSAWVLAAGLGISEIGPQELAGAIGSALGEACEGRSHAPLAEQGRAARAATERDDELRDEVDVRGYEGAFDLRGEDIPY